MVLQQVTLSLDHEKVSTNVNATSGYTSTGTCFSFELLRIRFGKEQGSPIEPLRGCFGT